MRSVQTFILVYLGLALQSGRFHLLDRAALEKIAFEELRLEQEVYVVGECGLQVVALAVALIGGEQVILVKELLKVVVLLYDFALEGAGAALQGSHLFIYVYLPVKLWVVGQETLKARALAVSQDLVEEILGARLHGGDRGLGLSCALCFGRLCF